MKYLFAAVLIMLVALSIGTVLSFPNARSEVPVLYWVTDPNPAREEQIEIFHRWLVKNRHGEEVVLKTMDDLHAFRNRTWTPAVRRAIEKYNTEGAILWDASTTDEALPITVRVPAYELRVDTSNRDVSKMVIQGVSGVGGDIMDLNTGSGVRYFRSIGLLVDVTDAGHQLNFDPSYSYEAMTPELTVDGRQYAFPCNVALGQFWVNKATFRKYGQPLPPTRWTFEEFERLGKQFVEAANTPGERQTVFYADSAQVDAMYRSLGLSLFNETLTRCTLDDDRFVHCLRLVYRWTYEDHILPSAAERDSFDTQTGYAGPVLQLFHRGHYAMFRMGRYALIQLRKFGDLELAVVELPHGGFPNAYTTTRAAGVYVGGRHKDLATLFLSYLASEDYNMQIVRDADALPPNPAFAQSEAFLRPKDYPNEWDAHQQFIESENAIAIGGAYSPFVLHSIALRHRDSAVEGFLNNRLTAEETAEKIAYRVNAEIDRSVAEDPSLRTQYEELLDLQSEIDACRAEGHPVPSSWIKNPFHRRYYLFKEWVDEDGENSGEASKEGSA